MQINEKFIDNISNAGSINKSEDGYVQYQWYTGLVNALYSILYSNLYCIIYT